MAKLVGRIPASRVKIVSAWAMPALAGESIIKATGLVSPGRFHDAAGQTALSGIDTGKARSADQQSSGTPKKHVPVHGANPEQSRKPAVVRKSTPGVEPETLPRQSESKDNPVAEDSALESQAAETSPLNKNQVEEEAINPPEEPQQNYSEGYLRGQKEGFTTGKDEGFIEGKSEEEAAGYQSGMEKGREAGAAEAQKKFDAEIAGKRELLDSLLNIRPPLERINSELTNALVPLVTGIAEAVLNVELSIRPELIRNYVTESLNAMPHTTEVVELNIHPDSVPFLAELPILEQWHVKIVEDKSLAIGGCRVSSSHSAVDQTLSQRLRDCLLSVFAEDTDEKEIRVLTSEAELNSMNQVLPENLARAESQPDSAQSGALVEAVADGSLEGSLEGGLEGRQKAGSEIESTE